MCVYNFLSHTYKYINDIKEYSLSKNAPLVVMERSVKKDVPDVIKETAIVSPENAHSTNADQIFTVRSVIPPVWRNV